MGWAILGIFLQPVAGKPTGPFGYALMAVMAVSMLLIAMSLIRQPRTGVRRSALELHALIVIDDVEWQFTIQARPGQTRVELIEQLRDRLPEQYQGRPVQYLSIESNVIEWGGATRFTRPRPTQIKLCSTTVAPEREEVLAA